MKSKRASKRYWNTLDEKMDKETVKYFQKNLPETMKHKPRWRQKLKNRGYAHGRK